jgi:hypothetical protein
VSDRVGAEADYNSNLGERFEKDGFASPHEQRLSIDSSFHRQKLLIRRHA